MKKALLFLGILTCSSYLYGAKVQFGEERLSGDASQVDVQRAPTGRFSNPGILPCPDQSSMTQRNNLLRLENHSRDCNPAAGALIMQPDLQEGDTDIPQDRGRQLE